jgi:hypothetical protein
MKPDTTSTVAPSMPPYSAPKMAECFVFLQRCDNLLSEKILQINSKKTPLPTPASDNHALECRFDPYEDFDYEDLADDNYITMPSYSSSSEPEDVNAARCSKWSSNKNNKNGN